MHAHDIVFQHDIHILGSQHYFLFFFPFRQLQKKAFASSLAIWQWGLCALCHAIQIRLCLRITPQSLFCGPPDQFTWMFRYAAWHHFANGLFIESPFGLPPSSIRKMTRLGGYMVWTMTYSHRPRCLKLSGCVSPFTFLFVCFLFFSTMLHCWNSWRWQYSLRRRMRWEAYFSVILSSVPVTMGAVDEPRWSRSKKML